MNDVSSRYGKEVMIAETGMPYDAPETTKSMLTDLIQKTKSVDNAKGIGVFYWEPECYKWCSYTLGAWNINGSPTSAMDAFQISSKISLPKDNQATPGFRIVSVHAQSSCVKIKCRLDCSRSITCRIYDASGKEVMSNRTVILSSGTHTVSYNVAGPAKGVYLVRINSGDKSYSHSIVITTF